jgi:5-methylcytosine-specific restriction endonuclease McrA
MKKAPKAVSKLIGKTINLLFVKSVHTLGTAGKPHRFVCICECGNTRYVSGSNLYGKNPIKSCGCYRQKRLRPYEALYRLAKRIILQHTRWTLELSYEEFLGFTKTVCCTYCGAAVVWPRYGKANLRVGYNLDRKDNTKGYTKQNCVVCCKSCNLTKGDRFTYKEFMLLSPALKRIQGRRGNEQK